MYVIMYCVLYHCRYVLKNQVIKINKVAEVSVDIYIKQFSDRRKR